MGLGVLATLGLERREVREGDDVPQRRQLPRDGLDLGQLLLVLADDAHRLGVRQQIADVLRRARRVDRDADGADAGEREVEEGPLEAVPRQQGERVSLPDTPREEPVGVCAHELVGLAPRDPAPVFSVLDEVSRALRAGRHGVLPEPRDRAPSAGRTRLRSRRCRLGHFPELTQRVRATGGETTWSL
jgi:hypothetical protein